MVSFANRMELIKASEIRGLLKLTQRPEIISFAGGLPAPELFPVEQFRIAANAVLDEYGPAAMQYSTTEGFPQLRRQIVERMAAKNSIHADPDDVLVISGSQQGLDYAGRIFLNPGDVVLVESPSYLGAINAFKANEPRFVEVPTDKDGLLMDELDHILATTDRVKLIYVIPDFQNPSGRTWPMERRRQFMDIINKYEIPVLEDNPYGELRYNGRTYPSLKSMDTKGLVMYLGTFSKILAPGYRVAWVCASPEILEKFNFLAQAASLQPSTISQLEISKYIELFDLDAHVEELRSCYAHRCKVMLDSMDETFPEEAVYTHPDGGLFTWVELPHYIDTKVMALDCLDRRVAYVPGESFFPNGGNVSCFRLNYSCMPDDRIIEGIYSLAGVIKQNLRQSPSWKSYKAIE